MRIWNPRDYCPEDWPRSWSWNHGHETDEHVRLSIGNTPQLFGGFHTWGYLKWLVYKGKSG